MLRFIRRQIDWLALNDRSYEFLFDPPPPDEAVSLDCETTGLNPKKDDIVSIAAVKIRGRRILTSEAFHAVVKPESLLGAGAIKIHHLRKQDVEGESSIRTVLPDLLRFIGSRPLVGYWISFDMRMLNKDVFAMLNIHLTNRPIDVCDLYYDRKYGDAPPGTQLNLRFAAILEDLKLQPRQAHNAFADATSAAEAYLILKDMTARGVRLKRVRRYEAV